MAVTETTKLKLKKQDHRDPGWHTALNDSFDQLDTQLTLTYAGNPNTHVAGIYVGQKCWDSTNKRMYACTTVGVAADAVWELIAIPPVYGEVEIAAAATTAINGAPLVYWITNDDEPVVTITSFGNAPYAGFTKILMFEDNTPITHSANIVISGGESIIAVPEKTYFAVAIDAAGKWRLRVLSDEVPYTPSIPVIQTAVNRNLVASDTGKAINFTAAGNCVMLDPATVDNGFHFELRNSAATGDVVCTAYQVDGITDLKLRPGDQVHIVSNGTAWNILRGERSYSTGEQSWVLNTLYSLSHGLGVKATDYRIQIICKETEFNWAVGDIVDIECQGFGNTYGTMFQVDDTTLRFTTQQTYTINIRGKDGSGGGYITASKWRIIVTLKWRRG